VITVNIGQFALNISLGRPISEIWSGRSPLSLGNSTPS